MRASRTLLVFALSSLVATALAEPRDAKTVVVGAGAYRPLFPASPEQTQVAVASFRMDRTPVTNGEFLAFVSAHPEWKRDRIQRVFAEPSYLSHWQSADALGANVSATQPVVNVSWFAARAYCGARGMRLPTEAEWEKAAAASRDRADGNADPAWRTEILSLYSRPNDPHLANVGVSRPNFWGLYDMHGLVWEWVSDFGNAVLAFGSGSDRLRFCGSAGAGATDATDFAAFERVAFRSSLHASYAIRSLGFRCAADARSAP